jgi:cytochrome c-type biogenesis protein CcmH/NrfF
VTSDKQKSPKSVALSPPFPDGRVGGRTLGFRLQTPGGRFARPSSLAARHYLFCLGAVAAFLIAASLAFGDSSRKPTLEALGNEVQCKCGCVAPLNQCPHIDCAEKAEMQGFIKKEIADGKDETAILQDLSVRYGVQVLTAPPAHGFNLTVWILPGVGLLAGLGIVVVIVRRWKRKPADVPAPTSASNDPKVLTAMEEEMKSTGMN